MPKDSDPISLNRMVHAKFADLFRPPWGKRDNEAKRINGLNTVLVIEDEMDLELITSNVIDSYFEVKIYNLKSNLDSVDFRNIDLVVTDYLMPKFSGYDVCKRARDLNPEIKTIVITALPVFPEYKSEVFDKIIHKPFDFEEIKEAIEELFEDG